VTGTQSAEAVVVRQSGGVVSVAGVGTFASSGLTQVVVNVLGGNDTVTPRRAGAPLPFMAERAMTRWSFNGKRQALSAKTATIASQANAEMIHFPAETATTFSKAAPGSTA